MKEFTGGSRDENLAPMACRQKPCQTVEGRPKEVVVSLLDSSRVDGHAHFDRNGKFSRKKLPLCRDRGLSGSLRNLEGSVEGASYGFENHSFVCFDLLAKDLVVHPQGLAHLGATILPKGGAPFDIGEEESAGAVTHGSDRSIAGLLDCLGFWAWLFF